MAGQPGSRRVTYIVLRFMRRPILVLVAVYSISMMGWVLIPGADSSQSGDPLSFFHAFYFLTYTATTTGFGEIPQAFTDAQRMWAMGSLYAGVVAWLYAVGTIVQLIQNPHFRQAIAEVRFARNVARISEPFVILCGFGNTGSLLTRGLSDNGITAVILDADPDRIVAVFLRDYRVTMYALQADARVPERLIEAGLMMPNCKAVVALTADEELNVKISVAARLLHPEARVITLSTHEVYDESVLTLGGDIHIIDPFQSYARYLGATIANPLVHMLNEWLIGAPGASLAMYPEVPRGTWILCGYGRMGQCIHEALKAEGIETVVIDPEIDPELATQERMIASRANQFALREAGIERAAGIVVGTNSDADNLSIALNAGALNPEVFILVRQNRHRNRVLFDAANADLIMQPSLVSARRILFMLIAPMLRNFFEQLRDHQLDGHDHFVKDVIEQLQSVVGGTNPRLWTVTIDADSAPALMDHLGRGRSATLGEILREPSDRLQRLSCVALVLESGDEVTVMPSPSQPIRPNDQILLCGTNRAFYLLEANLHNRYTLNFLVTGIDEPRGHVMGWLSRRFFASRLASRG